MTDVALTFDPAVDAAALETMTLTQSTQRGMAEAALALDEIDDPVSRKILDLHQRSYYGDYSWHYDCHGCDTGCSCDCASWPCKTVRLVAEIHGIHMPGDDWDRLNRPKDGSLDVGPPTG